MISPIDIRSPPVKVYSESHQTQRRLQPVRRTNTHGRPAWVDSPWMEWKISLMVSITAGARRPEGLRYPLEYSHGQGYVLYETDLNDLQECQKFSGHAGD